MPVDNLTLYRNEARLGLSSESTLTTILARNTLDLLDRLDQSDSRAAALAQEVERLRQLVSPFVRWLDEYERLAYAAHDGAVPLRMIGENDTLIDVTLGDFRALRAALKENPTDG